MEEQKNNQQNQSSQQNQGGCRCPWCRGGMAGYGNGRPHFILRLIIKIVIAVFIFAMGVKLGELKERFEGGYGFGRHHSHMMDQYYGGQYPGQYPNMMQRQWPAQTTPSGGVQPQTGGTPVK